MTLPASGQLSIVEVQAELGINSLSQGSANDILTYRNLAGVSSGQYSGSSFYGKARRRINLVISANVAYGYNIFEQAGSPTDVVVVTVTIQSGIRVRGRSPQLGVPWPKAPIIRGAFASGSIITLINNGAIMGEGGNGGNHLINGLLQTQLPPSPGGAGRDAIDSIDGPMIIINNGIIGGGGGGGAGGNGYGGGGGQPFGNGGSYYQLNSTANGWSGTATEGGKPYGYNTASNQPWQGLGAGPGVKGADIYDTYFSAGGGGLGAAGGDVYVGGTILTAGGAAGRCTTPGSNANITWAVTGTRYGPIE